MKKEQRKYDVEVIGTLDFSKIPKDELELFCIALGDTILEIIQDENKEEH